MNGRGFCKSPARFLFIPFRVTLPPVGTVGVPHIEDRTMPNRMDVPSGRTFLTLDLQIMEAAAETGFIRWYAEPQPLASGRKSHVYVHGRQDTTENPQFLRLCCRRILLDTRDIMHELGDGRRPRFIGIPHVAHGWTPALSMVDAYEGLTGRDACHAIMRSELKAHGVHKSKWIARTADSELFCDIQFDNTVTDTGSKVTATKHMREDGMDMSDVIGMVFTDRQQGGLKNMGFLGYRRIHANYLLLDMAFAFQQLHKWPADAAQRVEREIRENQITA